MSAFTWFPILHVRTAHVINHIPIPAKTESYDTGQKETVQHPPSITHRITLSLISFIPSLPPYLHPSLIYRCFNHLFHRVLPEQKYAVKFMFIFMDV